MDLFVAFSKIFCRNLWLNCFLLYNFFHSFLILIPERFHLHRRIMLVICRFNRVQCLRLLAVLVVRRLNTLWVLSECLSLRVYIARDRLEPHRFDLPNFYVFVRVIRRLGHDLFGVESGVSFSGDRGESNVDLGSCFEYEWLESLVVCWLIELGRCFANARVHHQIRLSYVTIHRSELLVEEGKRVLFFVNLCFSA